MEWNNHERAFVGYGYKVYPSYYFKDNKPYGWYPKNKKLSSKWQEADGSNYEKTKKQHETTDNGVNYWPGFHIFLKQKDAKNYDGVGTVIKVMFKDLICIGTNETYTNRYGACVIARYMKFIEICK